MDRRLFLSALLGTAFGAGLFASAPLVQAKEGRDGDKGSDDDGGSRDSSDDDDGKSDDNDSSHGSDGSEDDKEDDEDAEKDDSPSGSGSGHSGSGGDHQRAREAVDRGEILPLREILKRVESLGGGRVIAVDLNLKASRPYYTLKVQSGSNVKTVKLDAENGRKLNLFGW